MPRFIEISRACVLWIDSLNEWIGRSVAWLTLAMVLVTFAIVVLRYGFNLGWIALQEGVTYMHGVVFMLGAGYTLKHDRHVRVDILYHRCGEKTRAWIDLLGTLLFLFPLATFIVWSSWDYVEDAWAIRESSRDSGGLPGIYLLKTSIVVMALLLVMQGIALFLQNLARILDNAPRESV